MQSQRPPVSVIVPFAGGRAEAAAVIRELSGLELRDGDERIVVDNSATGAVGPAEGIAVVRADRLASSYYARNAGAERAANEWLLFVDSDCLLPPGLLGQFFSEAPGERCGIVAGEIDGDPAQTSPIARYHRSRGHLRAGAPLELGPSPAAGTANMLVRRETWRELNGFEEVASGADFDFCWRAGEAGWEVEYRPAAAVRHLHPESFAAMRTKARRYGAGQRWLDRRYPGIPRRPGLGRELLRGLGGAVVWTVTGRFERARFKLLDAAWIAAYAQGWRAGENTPRPLSQP
jgi:cellulose synthase/poly-beta-1,6-N-acetylglucosamine synthase-like glycosyltransferase